MVGQQITDDTSGGCNSCNVAFGLAVCNPSKIKFPYCLLQVLDTPSAGSHVYGLYAQQGAGTMQVYIAGLYPLISSLRRGEHGSSECYIITEPYSNC